MVSLQDFSCEGFVTVCGPTVLMEEMRLRIDYLSTGAGFLPSTVWFFCDKLFNVHFGMLPMFQCTSKTNHNGTFDMFWVFLFPESLVFCISLWNVLFPKRLRNVSDLTIQPSSTYHPNGAPSCWIRGLIPSYTVKQLGWFEQWKNNLQ